MNKKEDLKKIEYLISLFLNIGRLIRGQSSPGGVNCVFAHSHHFSMLKVQVVQLIKDEKPTMKRIAENFHIKAPSATSLINGLVKAGYVKRIIDKNDRRKVQMVTTKEGEKFLKEGQKHMTEKLKVVLLKLKKGQIDSFIKIMLDIKSTYK